MTFCEGGTTLFVIFFVFLSSILYPLFILRAPQYNHSHTTSGYLDAPPISHHPSSVAKMSKETTNYSSPQSVVSAECKRCSNQDLDFRSRQKTRNARTQRKRFRHRHNWSRRPLIIEVWKFPAAGRMDGENNAIRRLVKPLETVCGVTYSRIGFFSPMAQRVLARHAALTNHHHSYHCARHTAYDNGW